MTRTRVVWSRQAESDLNAIYDYVARDGRPQTAEELTLRLAERCESIGEQPRSGRQRDDLLAGLRQISTSDGYLIFYSVRDDRVVLARIVHGGRDYPMLFRSER